MADRKFQLLNARFVQWGRLLLMWPRGTPTAVVHGQLGWLNIQCSCMLRVVGLGTLRHACPTLVAARIAHMASINSHSFVSRATLVNIGVAPPSCWGLGPGISVVRRWLRHVKK